MIKKQDFEKLVKTFNFELVKKAMDAVGYNYTGDPVTIEELENMAWCLFLGYPDWNIRLKCVSQCGGFKLRKSFGQKFLHLSFCIEEATNEYGSEAPDA